MKIKSTLKDLDLFALPFQFSMGKNEKEKKTVLGGLVSLFIILASLSYLIYLTTLYFTNQLQPNVAILDQFSFQDYEINFSKSSLRIEIRLPNGSTLSQLESQTHKRYIQLIGTFKRLVNGQTQQSSFQLIQCTDDSTQYCLEFTNSAESISMYYSQPDPLKTQMFILFSYCVPQHLPSGYTCATTQETNALLLNIQSVVKVKVNLEQYNIKLKKFEQKNKQETFLFDSTNGFFSFIDLTTAVTTVSDGFLIQSSNTYINFSDYQRTDMALSRSYLSSQLSFNLLGVICLRLNGTQSKIGIQYIQYTQVLAEFSSILNALLFFGLFVRVIAETEIMQDLAEIQLQKYYKKAAFKLLSKEELERFSKNGIQSLIELNQFISKLDLQKIWSQSLNLSFFQKLKVLLFSSFGSKSKTNKTQKQQMIESIVKQTNVSVNIYSIQRELLQIKTILKIFLTPEQYAAIQLCGCDIIENTNQTKNENQEISSQKDDSKCENEEDQKIEPSILNQTELQQNLSYSYKKNQIIPLQNQQQQQQVTLHNLESEQQHTQLNHLEKIDMVDKDQDYFKLCVENFISNMQQNIPNQSKEVDLRIMDCLIQTTVVTTTEQTLNNNNAEQLSLMRQNRQNTINNQISESAIDQEPPSQLRSSHISQSTFRQTQNQQSCIA